MSEGASLNPDEIQGQHNTHSKRHTHTPHMHPHLRTHPSSSHLLFVLCLRCVEGEGDFMFDEASMVCAPGFDLNQLMSTTNGQQHQQQSALDTEEIAYADDGQVDADDAEHENDPEDDTHQLDDRG